MNSITVKMKLLVKWLGPGMAQGVAFLFLPHLFSFSQNAQYNSGEGIICMHIVGGKMS